MLYNAKAMVDRGLPKRPARRKLLESLISELKEIMPDATWSAAGIARHQLEINRWCLELGGHLRTGLEDNIKFDKDRLARSNAELVECLANLCGEYGRPPASCAEARGLFGLRTADAAGSTTSKGRGQCSS